MRLTIARKIALAVIAIVVVSIGTMAWVTSVNLQRGFIGYLNAMQAQDLDSVGELIAARYRKEGNFEWLHRRPRALREVLDQMKPQLNVADSDNTRRRPPRRPRDERPRDNPDFDGPPPEEGRPEGRPPRREDREGNPPELAPPPPGARDPMGFASRLSIIDAQGGQVLGPPDIPPGAFERKIIVDGATVGTMYLRPLRQANNTDTSATGFLREQMRDMLILSALLCGAAILLAFWLARHLLRPVAALRDVTEKLARGQFDARAPLLSRDELAELALHVNAMAQALEENEHQRRRMIADISHELRTPLTVIRGELEALIDGIRTADARALESLHAEVLRLNKLVDDLHQLTLADAGNLKFDWQDLEFDQLALTLFERYRPRAEAAGLKLAWSLPSHPVRLQGDAGRLTQVIINLLENSVRYTDAGGRIVATLTANATSAELSIEDSAPGVPAGAHASIFERLYRIDSARTRERGGSGLGLAICKMLVEAHGGTISAAPSSLGGVNMLLRLPLHAQRRTLP
jgi:two-component system sensor histidine kinase BaeS